MKLFQLARQEGRRKLNEHEVYKLLESYGIKMAEGGIAYNSEEALRIAERVGYPVVLKVSSREIIHKTDVGGVCLDVKTAEQVKEEFDAMIKRVKEKMPQASIDGVFVQKMVKDGYELILGGKRDEVFGPIVMLGLGGIYVEVFDDVSFRIAPVDEKEAMKMIDELKFAKVLKGFRGSPANLKELAKTVAKLSRMMMENPEIAEVDINPLLAGGKVVALDARVILY
jgi:succinyl-CoA synthetase beta subunit